MRAVTSAAPSPRASASPGRRLTTSTSAAAVRDWVRESHRVECELMSLVNPANVASRRVAEKLGAAPRETVTMFDGSPAVVWVHPR